jgi:hypothetical protein
MLARGYLASRSAQTHPRASQEFLRGMGAPREVGGGTIRSPKRLAFAGYSGMAVG